MIPRFFLIREYVNWLLKAKTRHGIHSPFVYQFLDNCLYNDIKEKGFYVIEQERKSLIRSDEKITYFDQGAGSRVTKNTRPATKVTRSVRSIALNSLQRPKYCRLFFRMARYLNAKNILELGTCFGITTAYLSLPSPTIRVDTIEGADAIAGIAKNLFIKTNRSNIHLYKGSFDKILPELLTPDKKYDMVFIDGDHKGESLLKYFNSIVKHINHQGVIVIDDIRWSESMFDAWKIITNKPEVKISIDLFNMGMVFFKPGTSKENFMIRF
jgi:predicted O-methyltransferase YrrM